MGWSSAEVGESRRGLERAYEIGVRLFDTADAYGLGRSERLVGELVRTVARSSVVLSSKVGYFSGTAVHAYHTMNLRHQLEQTLENLQTDYLDVYFFHNNNFGDDDRYLDGAVLWMREMQAQGVVHHIGMRGPHRYALDRLTETDGEPKAQRFHYLADRIQPEVLAVRDNLLSPVPRLRGVYDWAHEHGCGVLVNKPLAQGLLTGKYRSSPSFGDGDHRLRKAWFREPQLSVIVEAVDLLRELAGGNDGLLGLAIWACLDRFDGAVVLAGFTDAEQVTSNVAAAENWRPTDEQLAAARTLMAVTQQRLDRLGEVFVDEKSGRS